MKKFMKAIAFATVMCMLLSVAAFATEPDLEISEAGTISVTVTDANAANKQIAFVAANSDITVATDLATGNILDVQQVAFNGSGVATVTLNVGSAEAASVFYGYEGVGESAAFKTAGVVEQGATLEITLAEAINIVQNVESTLTDEEKAKYTLPENDIATLVTAIVHFEGFDAATAPAKMGWEFINAADEKKYVELDATAYAASIIDGDMQIGVTFANGSKDGNRTPFVISAANLYFKVIGQTYNGLENTMKAELASN